jgi:hypothetical protein
VQEMPFSRVYVNTGDPIEEDNMVEFRLLYAGELLPSSNTKRRAKEKHAIRRAFHPQLRRLWDVRTNLQEVADRAFIQSIEDRALVYNIHGEDVYNGPPKTDEERFDAGIKFIGKQWARAGYELVPVVVPEFALQCSLDILLLRPEEDRFIFEQGDIDGQVKTLFDALRIPNSPDETAGATPEPDEHPLFCLLQDDKLISEVKVTTDQLLMLPHEREVRANTCFVTIHVRLNHRDVRTYDNYFG